MHIDAPSTLFGIPNCLGVDSALSSENVQQFFEFLKLLKIIHSSMLFRAY